MNGFVLDNSVTMRWCFEDDSPYALKVLQDIRLGQRGFVPVLWLYEVISVLAESQRSGLLSSTKAEEFLADLRLLPIETDFPIDREHVF